MKFSTYLWANNQKIYAENSTYIYTYSLTREGRNMAHLVSTGNQTLNLNMTQRVTQLKAQNIIF